MQGSSCINTKAVLHQIRNRLIMPKRVACVRDPPPAPSDLDLCPVCETRVRVTRHVIGLQCSGCNGLTHLLCAAKEDQDAFHDLVTRDYVCATCSARASGKRPRHYMDALSPRMQEAVDMFSAPDAPRTGPTHSSAMESVLEIPNATLGRFYAYNFLAYKYGG